MRSYLIGIGLSVIAGCANAAPGMSYKVVVDPSVSLATVEACGAEWLSAVPGLVLSYEVSPCDNIPEMHSVCIFLDSNPSPADNALMHTDVSRDYDASVIHIFSSSLAKKSGEELYAFSNGLKHELGHFLANRTDHISKGNLMFFEENGNVEETIQKEDIEYFWANRK
jgi:hypothetical protein